MLNQAYFSACDPPSSPDEVWADTKEHKFQPTHAPLSSLGTPPLIGNRPSSSLRPLGQTSVVLGKRSHNGSDPSSSSDDFWADTKRRKYQLTYDTETDQQLSAPPFELPPRVTRPSSSLHTSADPSPELAVPSTINFNPPPTVAVRSAPQQPQATVPYSTNAWPRHFPRTVRLNTTAEELNTSLRRNLMREHIFSTLAMRGVLGSEPSIETAAAAAAAVRGIGPGVEDGERAERNLILARSKSWAVDFYNSGPSSEILPASAIAPQPSPAQPSSAVTSAPVLAPASAVVTTPNQEILSTVPTESKIHVVGTSRPTNRSEDTPQPDTPQYVASMMYECLTEHGCPDLISLIDPLGFSSSAVAEGGFGDIWKGRFHDSRRLAVKVLRFACLTGDNTKKELKRFAREIYHWSKLEHENVNKLMGVTMFQERLGVVSEWMEYGNLRQYLNRNPGANRPKLCVQITKGVVYLHGVNMVHGDLKAYNVLVSSAGVLKITDFDYSIFPECSLAFSATTRKGYSGRTLRWMAPELVLQDKPPQRNSKTDIYALGMTFLASIFDVCYVLLYRNPLQETITNAPHPYTEYQRDNQVYRKLAREEHPQQSESYSPDTDHGSGMWGFLLQCWDFVPASRPTADYVLRSILTLENDVIDAS